MCVDGGSYPFTGIFDLSGNSTETVARSGKTSFTVNLHVNLGAPDDQMTGSISNNGGDGWISALLADRAVFNSKSNPATSYAGRYTLVFPPDSAAIDNRPHGYGYATLTNNPAGTVALSGSLADNTAVSQSIPISKDGDIPLYVSLYSHHGSLQGWLNVSSNLPQTILGTNPDLD